jgi:hypothetical protein
MKSQSIIAAVLSAGLLVGCGDRGGEAENSGANQELAPAAGPAAADQVNPGAPAAPSPSSSARVDDAAARAVPPTTARDNNHGGLARDVRPGASTTVVPPPAPRPTFREITIPAGTEIPLELTTALSSETAQVETPVRARVRQAVVVDGATVIPAGATLIGDVSEVQRPGRVQGRARLAIRFNEMQSGGSTERLRTNPVVFQGEATKSEDATKVGIGAGVGAALGGILGGGDGAAKGAAIGGAAGAGTVLATRGRDVELASGTDITATLATPMEVRVSIR